ncbi:MAG: T9SS type A sorting domain-containing protein, partial [Cytophagales bacterium]
SYDIDTSFKTKFAIGQLDWIFGRNPFDLCMMTGVGTTTYPSYLNGQKGFNTIGGICNGITSKTGQETNLDWMPFDQNAPNAWRNWRWIEQWLPHDAWYLLAIGYLSKYNNEPNLLSNRNHHPFNSTSDFKSTKLRIFPNPSINGKFAIQGLNNESKQAILYIKNASGNTIHKENFSLSLDIHTFEINQLNKGIYFASIETDSGIETLKIKVID